MTQLPPELEARIEVMRAEMEARLARMPPLDLDAELRRIDAQLARQQADKATGRGDWVLAVLVVSSLVINVAAVVLVVLVTLRMPAGRHDDVSLLLISALFFLVFSFMAARR